MNSPWGFVAPIDGGSVKKTRRSTGRHLAEKEMGFVPSAHILRHRYLSGQMYRSQQVARKSFFK